MAGQQIYSMDLSLLLWTIAIVVVVYFILIWLPHTAIVPTYTSGSAEGARLISARNTEEQLVALGGRLDQFVLIGTHNSCHRANMLSRIIPHWQYSHAPLLEQLELGAQLPAHWPGLIVVQACGTSNWICGTIIRLHAGRYGTRALTH